MPLATINAIWIGPKLGPLHAACLHSFLRHGHQVKLHVYDAPSDVPDGVVLEDASSLLPASRIVKPTRGRHKGALTVFANLLRYELLGAGLGLYVDCDIFCLQPIADADYLFGYESNNLINNAVLKLPPHSAALNQLRAIKDARSFIPPWLKPSRKLPYRLAAAIGSPVKTPNLPWGSTGPRAVTWYVKQNGLDQYAAPMDVFYPVHHDQTSLLLDPELSIEDITTHRTKVLHLYSEVLKRYDLGKIPETSPLGFVLKTHHGV